MTKRNSLILVGVVAVILVLSYCFFGGSKTNHMPQDFPPDLPNPSANPSAQGEAAAPPPEAASGEPAIDSNGFLPTKMEDPKRFELLQKNIKDMSVCLNMKTGPFTQNDDMNFETLNTIIAPDLGEVVTTTEDWSATDIKTNSGEIRRIFIKNTPNVEMEAIRSLKYYSMQPNGTQKEIPLSKEQMANPSDTLIASLEADGQLVSKSSARKVYYQNGDDLSVVEKNGRIYSFELMHDQKTFKCSGVDSAKTLSCQCK
ncbi:hypothetical protein [Bdellovibrio svalbardensis]|uniref:Uncharacterized protein n=1 Tax=Bdellovibrio svalbardensis TaxID=2972972 RepID=A0ABT6DKA3_9BACT|nr:hypothetical protein [Bdellovibrio svalbardensis]MDG0817086.1 hypothetical protein [Bdellovibrio svalbardensis]